MLTAVVRRPVLPALLMLSPLAAHAQAPGYEQVDTRRIMAEYHAEVIQQINRIAARWGEAWMEDDVDAVLEQYWDEAVLIVPDQAPHQGIAAIRGYLERVLPEQGRMEAFMLDFDASGGMAVVYGNYMLEQGGERRSGPFVTVYLQRGRTWKIRSQVFAAG